MGATSPFFHSSAGTFQWIQVDFDGYTQVSIVNRKEHIIYDYCMEAKKIEALKFLVPFFVIDFLAFVLPPFSLVKGSRR